MASRAIHTSLEEFIARPERDDDLREELIAGEVIVSPGAKVWHAWIIEQLREQLSPLKLKGFLLMNDFSCVLGDRSMPIPDLAAVSKRRVDQSVREGGWLNGSPELVVEVASPSNRNLKRKADVYLENGAENVWIVYPKTKTVTVVAADGSTEARMGEALEFKGVSVSVSAIFPDV